MSDASTPTATPAKQSRREPYHELDLISSGDIRRAHFKSLYAYKFQAKPNEVTAAMRIGNHVHRGALEPHYFEQRLLVYSGKVRYGKSWDAFVAEHPEVPPQDIVNEKELGAIEGTLEGLKRNVDAFAALTTGIPEMEITWADEPTSLGCKAKPDIYTPTTLTDFKTVSGRYFSRGRLPRTLIERGVHIQLAHYVNGLRANGFSVDRCQVVVSESEPPHGCVLIPVSNGLMRIGMQIVRQTLDRIADCERTGHWPDIDGGDALVLGEPEPSPIVIGRRDTNSDSGTVLEQTTKTNNVEGTEQ